MTLNKERHKSKENISSLPDQEMGEGVVIGIALVDRVGIGFREYPIVKTAAGYAISALGVSKITSLNALERFAWDAVNRKYTCFKNFEIFLKEEALLAES